MHTYIYTYIQEVADTIHSSSLRYADRPEVAAWQAMTKEREREREREREIYIKLLVRYTHYKSSTHYNSSFEFCNGVPGTRTGLRSRRGKP